MQNRRAENPNGYLQAQQKFSNQNPNIYSMKEVESIIHLDDKVAPQVEPKAQFNEYYNSGAETKQMAKPNPQNSLKSKLQQNHKRKKMAPTIIRRTMNNQNAQMVPNKYYSNNPQRNFIGRGTETPKSTQKVGTNEQGTPKMNPPREFRSNVVGGEGRQLTQPTPPHGRVTLPSRYETPVESTREGPVYGNLAKNNQAIAELNEFKPTMYSKPQESNFHMDNKKTVDETAVPNLQNPIDMEEEISQISLPNVKSGVTLYKNIEKNKNEGLQKAVKLVKKEFVFKYNSDKNGLFYFLGTRGGRRDYSNPFELGQIKVFFSSLAQGDYSNFVGRSLTNCRTCNEENAFMGVDLGKDR